MTRVPLTSIIYLSFPLSPFSLSKSDLSVLSFLGESRYRATRPGINYISWKTRGIARVISRPCDHARASSIARIDRFYSARITLTRQISTLFRSEEEEDSVNLRPEEYVQTKHRDLFF